MKTRSIDHVDFSLAQHNISVAQIEMGAVDTEMYEIRLHGRGGQRLKEASRVLALAALAEGKHVQLAPRPGPNRVGAPAIMYLKISDGKIVGGNQVQEPDCVVVFDDKLPGYTQAYMGLKNGGLAVINTKVAESLNIETGGIKVASVDADKIACEVYGPSLFPEIGLAMLGAFVRGSELVELNSVFEALEKHLPGEVKEHIEVVEKAHEETRLKAVGGGS